VLAAYPDESVLFIRTYKQKFQKPPDSVDFDKLSVGTFDDPEGPTIECAPIAHVSIHREWLNSPDYGISELSDMEIDAVNDTIDMMNQA
jgi:hypothetical protein